MRRGLRAVVHKCWILYDTKLLMVIGSGVQTVDQQRADISICRQGDMYFTVTIRKTLNSVTLVWRVEACTKGTFPEGYSLCLQPFVQNWLSRRDSACQFLLPI